MILHPFVQSSLRLKSMVQVDEEMNCPPLSWNAISKAKRFSMTDQTSTAQIL